MLALHDAGNLMDKHAPSAAPGVVIAERIELEAELGDGTRASSYFPIALLLRLCVRFPPFLPLAFLRMARRQRTAGGLRRPVRAAATRGGRYQDKPRTCRVWSPACGGQVPSPAGVVPPPLRRGAVSRDGDVSGWVREFGRGGRTYPRDRSRAEA